MLKDTLIQMYERGLNNAIEEIKLYQTDEDLWRLEEGIANSGGNLALHLIGNLNHFFGAVLGGTGYVRAREAEFSDKNASRSEIVDGLGKAISVVRDALNGFVR